MTKTSPAKFSKDASPLPPLSALRPVVQRDRTGCALASAAVLLGRSYQEVKRRATQLAISPENPELWGRTELLRTLLESFKVSVPKTGKRFKTWEDLPDRALLAIKWHREKTGPAWHWVVFARTPRGPCVFDSKRTLVEHRRTDFGRMKPKWYLEVTVRTRD